MAVGCYYRIFYTFRCLFKFALCRLSDTQRYMKRQKYRPEVRKIKSKAVQGSGEDICNLTPIRLLVWQKPVQRCKAIILQLKKKKKKSNNSVAVLQRQEGGPGLPYKYSQLYPLAQTSQIMLHASVNSPSRWEEFHKGDCIHKFESIVSYIYFLLLFVLPPKEPFFISVSCFPQNS